MAPGPCFEIEVGLGNSLESACPDVRELRVNGDKNGQSQVASTRHRESWSHLDYAEGPVPALYQLGLAASICELRSALLTDVHANRY